MNLYCLENSKNSLKIEKRVSRSHINHEFLNENRLPCNWMKKLQKMVLKGHLKYNRNPLSMQKSTMRPKLS